MNEQKKLAWLDIETTGLDPDRDVILEIGIIITDENLNELAHGSWVCNPWIDLGLSDNERAKERISYGTRRLMLHEMSPTVLEMHAKSGLWREVLTTKLSLHDIEELAAAFLEQNGAPGSPVCGSTVHFDRSFLRSHKLDKLHKMFHYRNIDVSVLKNVARLYTPAVYESWHNDADDFEKAHRALPDLRESIREMAHYMKAWGLAGGSR